MSFSSSTPWNLLGLPLPKSQPPVPSIEASFGDTLWVASLWFEFGWIWLYVCICVCVFDTAVWNSQYLIFYLLLDSSAWVHVQKVSLLPPELFIDIWGNGMWSRWGFLSNGESASSQTWPEFQNWGLRRVQNSSAVKELGSPSVNKWGQTLRLHIHSPVTESNTFSFCHVLYQAPCSKDGQIQVLPSKSSKSVKWRPVNRSSGWSVIEICIKPGKTE